MAYDHLKFAPAHVASCACCMQSVVHRDGVFVGHHFKNGAKCPGSYSPIPVEETAVSDGR